MRKRIIALLLIFVLSGPTFVFAAEHPIRDAAVREAVRLALRDDNRSARQAGASQGSRSGGHPVLIGAIVGAGAGAIVGALGTCSADPAPEIGVPAPCGTRKAWALLGAGFGAGAGALVGLAYKAVKHQDASRTSRCEKVRLNNLKKLSSARRRRG